VTDEVRARLDALAMPFNRYGLDPFGVSKDHLGFFYGLLAPLYRHYFRVRTFGIEHVPASGRAMVIGNHSGGLPVDAAMVLAALFFGRDPPRHAHGMVLARWRSSIGTCTMAMARSTSIMSAGTR
jgi:1-acyl-sn-glycerol-3-phosphate acyltransferase